MNYHGIEENSILNGDGLRTVLWVSGCSHHCKGCQNPQTWNKDSGKEFNKCSFDYLVETLKPDYVAGLTLSGGDPLYLANRKTVTDICKNIKSMFPNKTIWLYTGYQYDEIKHLPILEYIDVLVDGRFIQELADVNYEWAGSTNQKVRRFR